MIGGEARNFAFHGDGSFHTQHGLRRLPHRRLARPATASSGRAGCRSRSTRSASSGPTSRTIPSDFVLTLSASVTGIQGIAGLDVLRLDRGHQDRRRQAARRRVPDRRHRRDRRPGQGQRVRRRDRRRADRRHPQARRSGNMIDALDTTTAGRRRASSSSASRAASRWPASAASRSGSGSPSSARSASSSRRACRPGSCSSRRSASSINDFAAGVEFFKTLPSIDDPDELRGPDFQLPTNADADQWLAERQAAGRQPVPGDPGEPVDERLRRRVHRADDDHRLARRSTRSTRRSRSSTARSIDQDLDRRQVPDHRQAQLRRRQHQRQRPPVRRPVAASARATSPCCSSPTSRTRCAC